MEKAILLFLNLNYPSPLLDALFAAATDRGYLLFIPLLIYLAVLQRTRQQSWKPIVISSLVFFCAIAINDWMSNEIKSLFERVRPCNVLSELRDVIGCSQSFSMPSSHASNGFAAAYVLWRHLSIEKTGIAIRSAPFVIAVLISFSRLYLGVHYPSDVLAGALIGIFNGCLVMGCFNAFNSYYKRSPIEALVLLTTIGVSLFRIYYIRHGGMDLSFDEAHYWEWSRRLDWSYYSKGPLIAYLIKAGTLILGNTTIGVRSFAVIMLAMSGLLIYKLTLEVFRDCCKTDEPSLGEDSKKAGLLALLSIHLIPLFSVYGIVFTIDSPFIFLWTLSLMLFCRALRQPHLLRYWLMLGVAIGLGMLTKYTMLFFAGCAFIYLLFKERSLLLRGYPYLTLIISSIVFLPVIIWNYQHDWVTLRHTAGQANIDSGMVFSLTYLGEFIGSQIGVLSPILFFMIIISLYRLRDCIKPNALWFLWSFSLPVLAFFILKSAQGKVQANWALPGYITALMAFSIVWIRLMNCRADAVKARRLLAAGFVFALLINIAGLYPHILKVPVKLDPSARLRGWAMLGKEVDALREEMEGGAEALIYSDSYQIASELAFYLKGNPVTYCISLGRRMNQYDLWEQPDRALQKLKERRKGKPVRGIFVSKAGIGIPEQVSQGCQGYEHRIITVSHKGREISSFNVFICYNLLQMPETKTERY